MWKDFMHIAFWHFLVKIQEMHENIEGVKPVFELRF
jgi:hypothetical protein